MSIFESLSEYILSASFIKQMGKISQKRQFSNRKRAIYLRIQWVSTANNQKNLYPNMKNMGFSEKYKEHYFFEKSNCYGAIHSF